jgi:hypothetical protein
MNTRWIQLTTQLDQAKTNHGMSKEQIVALWQARNDARGYAVLGDPAATIKVASLT